MSTATFEHAGYKIDVDQGGIFRTKISDVELSNETLLGLKAEIDKYAKMNKEAVSLPVVCTTKGTGMFIRGEEKGGKWKPKLIRCNITGINRTTRALQFDFAEKGYEIDIALADLPANAELLTKYLSAKAVMEELNAAVMKADDLTTDNGYGRLDISAYGKALATLRKRYTEAKTRG